MKIHREGHKIILGVFLFLLLLNFLINYFLPDNTVVQALVAVASVVFLLLVLNFFRDPNRYSIQDNNRILAPADGKIVAIEEVEEHEYFKDRRIQVSVFMSPTNVHINRNPIGGTVKYMKYHPGKYLVAWHPKSSRENERNTIVIKHEELEVMVRQIAGTVARRIVSYLQQGEQAEQGAEFGFIKFGSRVDVFLPT